MIRILGPFSVLLLSLLLYMPIVFIPGKVWALGCCGYTCKMTCTCRGTYPCLYDPVDKKTDQAPLATTDGSLQTNMDRDAPAFTPTTLDFAQSFSALTTASKCFRDKLALGLLGNARAGLKFVTFSD
jgi:hypothetical protein